jgi:hypothetical protein
MKYSERTRAVRMSLIRPPLSISNASPSGISTVSITSCSSRRGYVLSGSSARNK